MTARDRRVTQLSPQRLKRMLGKIHPHSVVFIVVASHQTAEIMAAAAPPDDSDCETLGAQRIQHSPHDGLVQRHRKVQEPSTEAAMFRSRPERQDGKGQGMYAMLGLGPVGGGCHQGVGEPAIEINGQMRALLLSTAKRDNRHRASTGKRCNLPVGTAPKAHVFTMPEGPRETTSTCPRDAPEPPSTANDRHQQHPANLKLARGLNLRATHGNALVMRSSLAGDEDQGAELPGVVRDSRRRARCVPDRSANGGNLRSLAHSLMRRLTCE
jgi:hypothetical protein